MKLVSNNSFVKEYIFTIFKNTKTIASSFGFITNSTYSFASNFEHVHHIFLGRNNILKGICQIFIITTSFVGVINEKAIFRCGLICPGTLIGPISSL